MESVDIVKSGVRCFPLENDPFSELPVSRVRIRKTIEIPSILEDSRPTFSRKILLTSSHSFSRTFFHSIQTSGPRITAFKDHIKANFLHCLSQLSNESLFGCHFVPIDCLCQFIQDAIAQWVQVWIVRRSLVLI